MRWLKSCTGLALCCAFIVSSANPAIAKPWAVVEGHFELDFDGAYNVDERGREERRRSRLRPELELGAHFGHGTSVEGYVQIELRRSVLLDGSRSAGSEKLELELEELFVDLLADGFVERIRVGRQEFEDPREWIYDEGLDGVRGYFRHGRTAAQLSVFRERLLSKDLLNHDRRTRINNYHAYVTYDLNDDLDLAAYWLAQDDLSPDDESPIFWGISSRGTLFSSVEHWLELAQVRGRDGRRRLRGYALDVGATYQFEAPLRPHATIGFATGSGDQNTSDDIDRTFRQTGFQDNEASFGGVIPFRYYGELLDPELSNLAIMTAGIGFLPSRFSSVDIVFHHFRQRERSKRLVSGRFKLDPTGASSDLGHEIDLIVGYHDRKRMRVKLILGYFMPGAAFANSTDDALFTGLETRLFF